MRPVITSTLPSTQVTQFGPSKVGDEVSFTVPQNTRNITIVQQAQIAGLTVVYKNSVIDNSAVPLTITKPDGGLAYDDLDGGAGQWPRRTANRPVRGVRLLWWRDPDHGRLHHSKHLHLARRRRSRGDLEIRGQRLCERVHVGDGVQRRRDLPGHV